MDWLVACVLEMQQTGDIQPVISRQIKPAPAVLRAQLRHAGRDQWRSQHQRWRMFGLAGHIRVRKQRWPWIGFALHPQFSFAAVRSGNLDNEIKTLVADGWMVLHAPITEPGNAAEQYTQLGQQRLLQRRS